MPRRVKPHVHGRDHEHGGADTTLIHYDTVDGGAGGAGYPKGIYQIERVFNPVDFNNLRYFEWSHLSGDELLDMPVEETSPGGPTAVIHPTVIDTGLYYYAFSAAPNITPAAGDSGDFSFAAMGADGFFGGGIGGNRVWQIAEAGTAISILGYGLFLVYQEAGNVVYATVNSRSGLVLTYSGACEIMKIGP